MEHQGRRSIPGRRCSKSHNHYRIKRGRVNGKSKAEITKRYARRYMAATGCQWRMLPKEFPPYSTVQGYFYRWRDEGRWATINHHLVMTAREAEGREASSNAGAATGA